MADFRYVTKKEASDAKRDVIEIIHKVQDIVRDDFTFKYSFIGSCAKNMITYDADSNVGYDFDVNFEVNDPDEKYTPQEIRGKIFRALQQLTRNNAYSYTKIEDSTSVITIKVVDRKNARIIHSCDFAIVHNCSDGRQQYIRYNKSSGYFSWEFRGEGYTYLPDKIEWLKAKGLWGEVRNHYLYKKDNNRNPDKHSRTIFAETINEVCQQNSYSEPRTPGNTGYWNV